MSVYNDPDFERFKEQMKDAPASQKMAAVRMEMKQHTPRIKGYAELMKQKIQSGEMAGHEQEFLEWLTIIVESSQDIDKLMEILK